MDTLSSCRVHVQLGSSIIGYVLLMLLVGAN